jgi:serine/threonine-protein kinase
MEAERRERIEALFDEVVELEPASRAAWLERATAGDASLRRDVEALLAAHARAEGILDAPLSAVGAEEGDAVPFPARIGAYRLVRELGRGGMGVVFLGERADGQFEQRVAVKVMGIGPDTDELRRRIEGERRILATLEHPNIARLLDGGVTADGRPYLVMEYVDGEPIDVYCDAHRLPIDARLRLFATVARALHHAHRNLVVHRDLKPSNILVTADGTVKLLDFGIAKILDPDLLGAAPPVTRTGLRLMTPEYASPEQVRGERVTTGNDVYGLGVVLYELLTGRRPFDLAGRPFAECERIILEREAPRPSAVIRRTAEASPGEVPATPDSVSTARRTTVDRLRRRLGGDLDRIALQALRKEPHARYASAEQFAEDVERHLDGMPVLARGRSAAYRARKFLWRHRVGAAATTLVLLSLLGGIIGTTAQARRAAAERDRATGEADRAARVAALMMDLFRLSDPTETLGDTITARQVLDEGAARILRDFGDEPASQAMMLSELARVYENLGLLERAEPLARRALALRETLDAAGLETARSLGQLARLHAALGRREEAVAGYRRALALQAASGEPEDTVLARHQAALAWEIRATGDHEEAARLFDAALTTQRRILGDTAPELARTLLGLAAAHHDAGRFDEAEAVFTRALERYDSAAARPDPVVATAMLNVGMIRRLRQQYAAAGPLLESALAMRSALYDADHPDVVDALGERASLLIEIGRYGEAERLLRDGLARAARTVGPSHPTAIAMSDALGDALVGLGRHTEAVARFDTTLAAKRQRHGGDHPAIAYTLLHAGEAALLGGDLPRAATYFDEARAMATRTAGDRSVYRALALHGLARIALARGEVDEAERTLAPARALADSLLRPDHRYTLALRRTAAAVLFARGSALDAVAELRALLAVERLVFPSPHPTLGLTLTRLGEAHLAAGQPAEAARTLQEALRHFSGLPTADARVTEANRLLARATSR